MMTDEALEKYCELIREACNRFHQAESLDTSRPDQRKAIAFLSLAGAVACYFDRESRPSAYELAQEFERTFEPGPERVALVTKVLNARAG